MLRNVAAGAADAAAGALDEVVVTSTRETRGADRAEAASEGTVTSEELSNRPLLRPAEVLEAVPGLVVTQHSGDGKANQYFLRGSTSTTARTSRRSWMACRSTCRHMPTGRVTAI